MTTDVSAEAMRWLGGALLPAQRDREETGGDSSDGGKLAIHLPTK